MVVKKLNNSVLKINFDNHNANTLLNRIAGASDAYICPDDEKNLLAVFPDIHKAGVFVNDFKALHPNSNIYLLNELPLKKSQINDKNFKPLLIERGEIIKSWRNKGGVLAVTPGGLMTPCMNGGSELELTAGKNYSRDFLTQWLEKSGYTRSNLVYLPGQYIIRGFICDIYDPAYAMPLRLEFFDETLEQISAFKPSNQKTVHETRELFKITLHDMNFYEETWIATQDGINSELLPGNTCVIFYEPSRIEIKANAFAWLWEEIYSSNIVHWREIYNELVNFKHVRITSNSENFYDAAFDIVSVPTFKGDFDSAERLFKSLISQNYALKIFSPNRNFKNYDVVKLALSSGFIDHNNKIVCISERELSGVIFVEAANSRSLPLEMKDRLSAGQLVMHEDYGIGIFTGIETVMLDNSPVDVLAIEFAKSQRLLIPVMESYKLTPLNTHADENTKLDSLNGKQWKRDKAKTQERAIEEAKILLEIFAKRELERRAPIDEPNDVMYQEFLDAFQFDETADQLKAVDEIMKDLSSPYPMDRLLVGDVGFGKTEVALRAAFRFILAGFQVCVLVPTTVLAQQHFVTFQARFAGFPVKIGLLSRFVTKTAANKLLKEVEEGRIDILIGTHKLLSSKLQFKRLGFLVIDEEHRFGVVHKETIKKNYGDVDILSLTATPIPRTLAMSLQGLRSISVLTTPPENRQPVTTFSGAWDLMTVRRAIAYELNRGGQVYFLSNRISRLENYKEMLEIYFPEAVINTAHGQMTERELEKTMFEFYSGTTDILIATAIIESGLDVGRANTIIIDNSEELGLAQMYQLRGRVGRRGENAFAYFFYPSAEKLNSETQDRLEAISSFTELGSGYDIARRDLDIRGSGELIGTHQHGNFKGGNIHLFYKLLERELAKMRGTEMKIIDVKSDRNNGYIPIEYIPQEDVRVLMYRRFLRVRELKELEELLDEMSDRFGTVPAETKYLAGQIALKNFGSAFKIDWVEIKKGLVIVRTDKPQIPETIKKYLLYLGDKITWA